MVREVVTAYTAWGTGNVVVVVAVVVVVVMEVLLTTIMTVTKSCYGI